MKLEVEIPEGQSCISKSRCPFFIVGESESEDFCNYLWWKWNLGREKITSINCPSGTKNPKCPSLLKI